MNEPFRDGWYHFTPSGENIDICWQAGVERCVHVQAGIGVMSAMVQTDHGFEPMGFQIWRGLRQLFLRLYGV